MQLSNKYINLSNRAVFRLSGPDAERYLNGQITQNVKKATEQHALHTCITNAKGKLQGIGSIRRHEGAILLDAPIELQETLMQRLDMYLIADDATLEDVSSQYHFYHVLESEPPENAWAISRYGVSGYDTLTKPNGEELTHEKIEQLRISNKIPSWSKELDETILPPEALLEAQCISYDKGCYIGQEVISRIKSASKINRRLTQFTTQQPVTVPSTIPNPIDAEAKAAGTVTSICHISGNQYLALGYLTKKWFETDTFTVGDTTLSAIHPNAT